jgi:putative membrane protein
VALVPCGIVHIFHTESILEGGALPYYYLGLFVPFSVLTIWMFLTWEYIGDTTEDPFENKMNDVPMTALTRTIEIDLRDALNEKNLPPKYPAQDNILY